MDPTEYQESKVHKENLDQMVTKESQESQEEMVSMDSLEASASKENKVKLAIKVILVMLVNRVIHTMVQMLFPSRVTRVKREMLHRVKPELKDNQETPELLTTLQESQDLRENKVLQENQVPMGQLENKDVLVTTETKVCRDLQENLVLMEKVVIRAWMVDLDQSVKQVLLDFRVPRESWDQTVLPENKARKEIKEKTVRTVITDLMVFLL